MSSSPTQPLTPEQAAALHQRLLAQDPTAANDLANAYLEPLVAWLGETNHTVAEDLRLEAAGDALIALIRKPQSYSPQRQTLEVYLRMSARGDLRNRLRKERRQQAGQVTGVAVELLADDGKYLGGSDDPALPLCLAEEMASSAAVPESLRRGLSPTDLRAVELILQNERCTAVFAELFGLAHLPVKDQRREVKRHKDRLKLTLKRARSNP